MNHFYFKLNKKDITLGEAEDFLKQIREFLQGEEHSEEEIRNLKIEIKAEN